MGNDQKTQADVVDPRTGEPMVLESALDPTRLRKQHAEIGMNPGASARFIEQHQQKNEQLGPIYINPRTGYMMRVKANDAPASS